MLRGLMGGVASCCSFGMLATTWNTVAKSTDSLAVNDEVLLISKQNGTLYLHTTRSEI